MHVLFGGSSQKLTVKRHGSLRVLQAWLWLGKTRAEDREWLSGWGEKLVQGPCCQEEPNARSWARSPMRVAKLGRA
jgi:hypothetical protein